MVKLRTTASLDGFPHASASGQASICFAHVAYRLQERFALQNTGIASFELRDLDTLAARLGEADVLVISGLWRNSFWRMPPAASSSSRSAPAPTSFRATRSAKHGVRLASAAGVNARAVAEHAMALILAFARRLPEARDNQHKRVWRG